MISRPWSGSGSGSGSKSGSDDSGQPRGQSWAGSVCDVWWAAPSDSPALAATLSPSERDRAARLGVAADRHRYTSARALLRTLLAERIGVPPPEVPLVVTCPRCGSRDHGKPRLLGESSSSWPFSVAHRGDRVVVALTAGRGVGVDVETADAPERAGLAAGILCPEELGEYRRVPEPARGRALGVWWSRKEAVLKATGDGLAVPPSQVHVSGPHVPPALLSWWGDGAFGRSTADRWAVLRDLEPGAGYVGCVAVLGRSPVTVHEHDGNPVLEDAQGASRAHRRA